MHTHVSAVTIATVFLGVLVATTFWRLAAGVAEQSGNPTIQELGRAMAFQL